MYKKNGNGAIITTRTGSTYQLESLVLDGHNYQNEGNSNMYLVTRTGNDAKGIQHPVIAYSYKKAFITGDRLEMSITDDSQNGEYKNQKLMSSEITDVRVIRGERPDIISDLHPELLNMSEGALPREMNFDLER